MKMRPLTILESELEHIWCSVPTNKVDLKINEHITLISLDYDEKEEPSDPDFIEKVYCTFNCMGVEIDLDFVKKSQTDDFVVSYDKLLESESYLYFESNIPSNKDFLKMVWQVLERCI